MPMCNISWVKPFLTVLQKITEGLSDFLNFLIRRQEVCYLKEKDLLKRELILSKVYQFKNILAHYNFEYFGH